jgi:hypothetical protein
VSVLYVSPLKALDSDIPWSLLRDFPQRAESVRVQFAGLIRVGLQGVATDALMAPRLLRLRRPNMARAKARRSSGLVEELMAEKSGVLSKAQALTTMGMGQTAQPLWALAASLEERIAPLLDAAGDELEAAVHRISAASCYEKAGDPSRATNLYRAALAGRLREVTRKEVEGMLTACLARLKLSAATRKPRRAALAS